MTPEEFEENARLVAGDPSWSLTDDAEKGTKFKSFPPVTDTIDFVKQVDWEDVRRRCRAGFNNCGLVIAVVGEKIHDLGAWMAQV